MWRYAKYALPFILKAPKHSPAKNLAGRFASVLLIFAGLIFLAIAAFIWVSKTFGVDVAFLSLGVIFLLVAIAIRLIVARNRTKDQPVSVIEGDPLAPFIPDNLKENPTVQKLLLQISQNPIAATAGAVTIGMLISKEFLEDNHG